MAEQEKLPVPDDYYRRERPEIVALIPEHARKILDVGCAEGSMASRVRALPGVEEVTGIEINEVAAAVARQRLHRVIVGDLEVLDLDIPDGYFDCIICADVLEHMKDPWAALRRLRRILTDDGVMLVCLPNLRNVIPMVKILFDRWEYEEEGIVDQTHLRFFTPHTMEKMFRETGFVSEVARRNCDQHWVFRTARLLSFGLLTPFTAFSYVLYARKSDTTPAS